MAESGAGRMLGGTWSESFMESAILVYAIVAAACSSPQTAEINAGTRSTTLMKWVKLGLGQSALFLVVAAVASDHPSAVLSGGFLAGGVMWASYMHANRSGLASDAPGTEST